MTRAVIRGLLIRGDRREGVVIEEVKIDAYDKLGGMQSVLEARHIDGAGMPRPGHGAWINDEGLFLLEDNGGFLIETTWHPEPLPSPILITGLDTEGQTIGAECQPWHIQPLIRRVVEVKRSED